MCWADQRGNYPGAAYVRGASRCSTLCRRTHPQNRLTLSMLAHTTAAACQLPGGTGPGLSQDRLGRPQGLGLGAEQSFAGSSCQRSTTLWLILSMQHYAVGPPQHILAQRPSEPLSCTQSQTLLPVMPALSPPVPVPPSGWQAAAVVQGSCSGPMSEHLAVRCTEPSVHGTLRECHPVIGKHQNPHLTNNQCAHAP